MKRVFVSGASGNVGKLVVRNVLEREGFELAGGWCLEAGLTWASWPAWRRRG